MRFADDIGGDKLVGRGFENPLPARLGFRRFQNRINFFDRGRPFGDKRNCGDRAASTGTRRATPSNFPASDLTARVTAIAAPVVEGVMFTGAARPRRKSVPLAGPSTND